MYRKRTDNNKPKTQSRKKTWIPQWCRGKQKKHSHVFFFCCVLFFIQSVARHHHEYDYYPYDTCTFLVFFSRSRIRYLFSTSNVLYLQIRSVDKIYRPLCWDLFIYLYIHFYFRTICEIMLCIDPETQIWDCYWYSQVSVSGSIIHYKLMDIFLMSYFIMINFR